MLKKLIPLLSIFLILASITVTAFAHGGNTDGNGGHYNGSSYHYHHGYPAHQHTGGQCPYDFDDQTDHSSGNSSNNPLKKETSKDYFEIVLGLTFASWAPVTWSIIHYNENKKAFRFWFALLLLCVAFLLFFISKNTSLIWIPIAMYLTMGSLAAFCFLAPKKPRLAAAIAIIVFALMFFYS